MSNKKEDTSTIQYCARSLLPNIKTLNKTARSILKRSNIEDIHDLRVSSRRIGTVIDVFFDYLPNKKVRSWQKDIRAITKSFGSVRDLDVQINLISDIYASTEDNKIRSGLRRIRLRLQQKRQQKQADINKTTRMILDSVSINEMKEWTGAMLDEKNDDERYFSSELYQVGYKHIQTRLDEFLFYEVFIFDPTRVKELHQMRISAKQLRYALEVFSYLYKQKTNFALDITRQAQEYLGSIHDSDMWANFLSKFTNQEMKRIKNFYGYSGPYQRIKPGIEYLNDNRKRERNRLYANFLKEWKNWKFKETWLNLRKLIFLTSLETNHHPPEEKASSVPIKTPTEQPAKD
ncbi:MAG: CHAD domain-containing protein [Anaerolineaceae bacterium]|nr:CHAD domain-containing protein [Anaerolineaceae bacterium]